MRHGPKPHDFRILSHTTAERARHETDRDGRDYRRGSPGSGRDAATVRSAPEPHEPAADGQTGKTVKSLRIYSMSTAVAGSQGMKGLGEWGFAALVEADGRSFLFDTGLYPDTVARNADELGVNLAGVTDVVLSHNHNDHTGGLLTSCASMPRSTPSPSP